MSDIRFSSLKQDLPAGLIVFFVALPLNLGIAQASGTPLLSGAIAGIVGGLFVSFASGSRLSVTGPAAGLILLVLGALETFSFPEFLCAVMLAGLFQLALGFVRAGFIALFFPSSVIKGMLAAIGLVIIFKQIPHLAGLDSDLLSIKTFLQADARKTFGEISRAFSQAQEGPLVAGALAMAVLLIWEAPALKKRLFFRLFSGPLVAVAAGLLAARFLEGSALEISQNYKVSLPVFETVGDLQKGMTFPDFSALLKPQIYLTALGLGLVASIETLLSLEAVDQLDTHGGKSPKNRELLAQGGGNILSGLLGGLPLSAVILRSSANVNAGGKTRASAFIHGFFLLVALLFGARLINQIPNAALAAILIMTGCKLSKPRLYFSHYKMGRAQFAPFVATILAILLTDLLAGIAIGMAFSFFFILKAHYLLPAYKYKAAFDKQAAPHHIEFSEVVSFLNKAYVQKRLEAVPSGGNLIIDATKTMYFDFDVLEAIYAFLPEARKRSIEVELRNVPLPNEPRVLSKKQKRG